MKRCNVKVPGIGLALLGGVAGSGCTTVLKTDFETDPVAAGWECGGLYGSDSSDFLGQWGRIEPATEGHCLSVRKGLWQSPRMPEIRAELGIATLDMRTVWDDCITTCAQPRQWYQRDEVHANARGKQIMARIDEHCFRPD